MYEIPDNLADYYRRIRRTKYVGRCRSWKIIGAPWHPRKAECQLPRRHRGNHEDRRDTAGMNEVWFND